MKVLDEDGLAYYHSKIKEYINHTINKLTLDQYKDLYDSDTLDPNKVYVITDLLDYIKCVDTFNSSDLTKHWEDDVSVNVVSRNNIIYTSTQENSKYFSYWYWIPLTKDKKYKMCFDYTKQVDGIDNKDICIAIEDNTAAFINQYVITPGNTSGHGEIVFTIPTTNGIFGVFAYDSTTSKYTIELSNIKLIELPN